jgi:hypothetical protein
MRTVDREQLHIGDLIAYIIPGSNNTALLLFN